MYAEEDVEQIFLKDCKDKKRTASGIHGRALRLRKNESVVMPSDHLKGFQKRLITGAGCIKLTTVKEVFLMDWFEEIKKGTIPTPEQIDKIAEEQDFESAQSILAELLRLHNLKDLQKGMPSMKDYQKFKAFCQKYQVAKDRSSTVFIGQDAIDYVQRSRKPKEESQKRHYTKRTEVNPAQKDVVEQVEQVVINKPETTTEVSQHPLIYYKRKFTAEQLTAFFERLSLFLDNTSQYEIEITLKEVSK